MRIFRLVDYGSCFVQVLRDGVGPLRSTHRDPQAAGSHETEPSQAAVGVAAGATRNGGRRNRLLRAAETLTPNELANVQDAMRKADGPMASRRYWQGAEPLRRLLQLAGTDPDCGRIWYALTRLSTCTAPTPN